MWPFNKSTKDTEVRAIPNVPDKVFIENKSTNDEEWFLQEPAGSAILENLLNGFYGTQNYLTLFTCLPEIYAPIHEIASRVADAIWELKKDWNDEVDYGNEAFNKLFSSANPIMTTKKLIYQAVCYEILTGKQFFYLNRPIELSGTIDDVITWSNLPAHKIWIDQDVNADLYSATEIKDVVRNYELQFVGNKSRKFDPNKVIPILHTDIADNIDLNKVMPLIRGAEKAIKNLLPVYEARGLIYIKRGAMGFVVSRKSDDSGQTALTPTERKELAKDFTASYGLSSGKDTFAVTSLPVDFVRTAMSIQELQPFEETMADAVAIYGTLRVPRHLVPSKDQSTFSNASADMKSFYEDTIIPWAERYAEAFTAGFKTKKARRYIKPNFSHISVLQENKKDKAEVDKKNGETWEKRWKNGACTLNEWIVSFDGNKGSGPLYEKKIFELTPDEVEQVKSIINLKSNATQESQEDRRTEEKSGANSVQ